MKMTLANQISIVRIFLIAPFVICLLKAGQPEADRMRYAALFVFSLMCLSDVLDGYIARVKKQVTRLGSFLDPMADKLLITCACILLASHETAVEGFTLPVTVVVLIVGKDMLLLVGFLVIYLITSHIHIIPASAGKLATFLQLSMVAAILIGPEVSALTGVWVYIVKVLWWSAAGCAVLVTLVYIRNGIQYIEEFEEALDSGQD